MHASLDLLTQHGVWVLFAIILAARLGAPVPAAPLLTLMGGLVAATPSAWPGIVVASLAANVAGDGAWFLAGRRFGHRVLRMLCKVSLSPDVCVRQSETMIVRWGASSLIAAKFLPGISVVAAPLAGALGMSTTRFLVFDGTGSLLWSMVYLGVGVALDKQVQRAIDAMTSAGTAAGLVFGVALLVWLAARLWRRRAQARQMAMPRISVDALHALMSQGTDPVLIDVRSSTSSQLDGRHIPGATFVALKDIGAHAAHLPRDREIVLYCNCPNEASAARAAQVLLGRGFTRVRPLGGGLEAWVAAGHGVATVSPGIATSETRPALLQS